jgi:tetratricopeptide (TPR) repeat protein
VSRAYGPTDRAARDFRRALALAPNAPQALAWSGSVFAWQGNTEAALRATQRATDLNPLSPAGYLSLALAALQEGDLDLAITAARRSSTLEPELVEARALEGRALLLAGRLDECLNIDFGPHAAIRATCLHSAGREADARAIVDSVAQAVGGRTLHDPDYTEIVRADGLASHYAWIGDRPMALRWLGHAFARSPIGVDRRVLESAIFDRLRDDPAARRQLETLTSRVWPRVEQRGAAGPADRP